MGERSCRVDPKAGRLRRGGAVNVRNYPDLELVCSLRYLSYSRFVYTVQARCPVVARRTSRSLQLLSLFVKKLDSKSDSISARHAENADKREV
jgi:hypothetical protein